MLGNGDIWEAHDALAMLAQTGCDGVVVGRGCLGRPWLFRDLVDAFAGRPVQPPPSLGEVAAVMRDHAERLVDVERRGRRHEVVPQARRLVPHRLPGRRRAPEARPTWSPPWPTSTTSLDGLDPDAEIKENALRAARGHTNGPRRVVLPEGWLDEVDDPTPPEGAELLVSGG